jgi:hypothetical protein
MASPTRHRCEPSLESKHRLTSTVQMCSRVMCTVRVFRQKFTLEDAIGSHACSLEANIRVTNGIPLGSPLILPVDTVNCVQTLKARGCTCAHAGWIRGVCGHGARL